VARADNADVGHRAILWHDHRHPATAFDFDLAIGDRAGDVAGSTDQEPLADDKLAPELAPHLSLFDGSRAFEEPALGDLHLAAFVQTRLYTALDYEPIAGFDVAREGYLAPDNHGSAFCLVRSWRGRRTGNFIGLSSGAGRIGHAWRHNGLCNWP